MRTETMAQRKQRIAKQQAKEQADRVKRYLKAIGHDTSLVTELRRLLARRDMGPRQRMAIFSMCRMADDAMRFNRISWR